jgi:DNA-directed RNA polymerase subunit RPC12/RpoP
MQVVVFGSSAFLEANMNHTEIRNLLNELSNITHAQEQVIRVIWAKTIRKNLPFTSIARNTLALWAGLSDRGVKLALDALVNAKYVDRLYVCGHCGCGIGMSYGDVHTIQCPACGHNLFKHIRTKLKLSTRGKTLASRICVNSILEEDEYTPTHDIHTEYAERVGKLLGESSPIQIEYLARFHRHDIHSNTDWEIALALACDEHRQHGNLPIWSLRGLLKWCLYRIDENRPKEPTCEIELEPHALARVHYALDRLDICDDYQSTESELEHMAMVSVVYQLYLEHPYCAKTLDKLANIRGREPRTLRKSREGMLCNTTQPKKLLIC